MVINFEAASYAFIEKVKELNFKFFYTKICSFVDLQLDGFPEDIPISDDKIFAQCNYSLKKEFLGCK
ncbi:MAG TPA: hypothetical protein VLB74_06155, partial [Flavobacterium sp.]|uniref:hypothetical protein n=1 Tax=Flavobacterium sp. TaxID=239 RepID=UPI002B641800